LENHYISSKRFESDIATCSSSPSGTSPSGILCAERLSSDIRALQLANLLSCKYPTRFSQSPVISFRINNKASLLNFLRVPQERINILDVDLVSILPPSATLGSEPVYLHGDVLQVHGLGVAAAQENG